VRHAAVHAIAGSPHPKAIELLWTFAEDRYYGVRLTVLHKGRRAEDARGPRHHFQTMTSDANETVRNEAIRYMKVWGNQLREVHDGKASRFSYDNPAMYLGIEIGGTKLQLGLGAGDGTLASLWRGGVTPAEGAEGIVGTSSKRSPSCWPMLVWTAISSKASASASAARR